MQFVKQFTIQLKTGETLTVDMSDKLLSQIKANFQLTSDEQVTDRHVKYFLVSSMNNMLEATDVREAH